MGKLTDSHEFGSMKGAKIPSIMPNFMLRIFDSKHQNSRKLLTYWP